MKPARARSCAPSGPLLLALALSSALACKGGAPAAEPAAGEPGGAGRGGRASAGAAGGDPAGAGGASGGAGAAGAGGASGASGGAGTPGAGGPPGAGGAGAVDAVSPGANPPAVPGMPTGNRLPPGTPVGLPMIVTDRFQNRGWFGDPGIEAFFGTSSRVISESVALQGPCAARPPGAAGRCLRYSYTPPAGLVAPPEGGHVGLYFLTTVTAYHPEVAPTPRPGEANWGYEPTVALPPGATDVSFWAMAEQPGVTVTFRVGADQDNFAVPALTETLSTTWKQYRVSLAGAGYGANVIGPFGWTIQDTSRAATFYLDGIVWNGTGGPPVVQRPAPPPIPSVPAPPGPAPLPALNLPGGQRNGSRQLVVANRCTQPLWIGSIGRPTLEGGGFRLEAQQQRTLEVPATWVSGRIWARTACRFDATGVGPCETGTCRACDGCSSVEKCGDRAGETPVTLAEFTFQPGSADIYDLSLVDGYNLPMVIAPLPGTFTATGARFNCKTVACTVDLNAACPPDLRFRNKEGVVGCMSGCTRYNTDALCCANASNTPATCPASAHSRFFKTACPDAYSYAYDDPTSTFDCQGEDYAVIFCP